MYVCMYIYVYMYIYICIYVYTYTLIHAVRVLSRKHAPK